ncbi:lipopolysaccharide assembly protein LapA domain-containing protein [Acidimicrobiia bacterium EGI L10123]|uniref:lipopolysaccharide assembly protein LapA domain-containing protein n=1 Tax=Salinilacustrithrix flava TaxID=2957203 RepID=UPI003D7C2709|nr:lipopolysaccharide assembly protein LapA domain-containing protein [Acidimicrobiia bacterium EGI L10123]
MAAKDRDRDDSEVVNRYAGTGVTPTVIALALLAIAVVILLAQNTASVPFQFLTFEADVPLYVLFLVTALGASLMTVLASAIWRRRRRRARNEHEELERLRQR